MPAPKWSLGIEQPVVQDLSSDNKVSCIIQELGANKVGLRIRCRGIADSAVLAATGKFYVCIDGKPVHRFDLQLDDGRSDEVFVLPEEIVHLAQNRERWTFLVEINQPWEEEQKIAEQLRLGVAETLKNPDYQLTLSSISSKPAVSSDGRLGVGVYNLEKEKINFYLKLDPRLAANEPALANGVCKVQLVKGTEIFLIGEFNLTEGLCKEIIGIPEEISKSSDYPIFNCNFQIFRKV